MIEDLRKKLRPFIEQLVTKYVEEAAALVETKVIGHLRSAFDEEFAREREREPVKPPPKRVARRKKSKPRTRVDRDVSPSNITQRDIKPDNASARRPCGCGIRGPHRRDCSSKAPVAKISTAPTPAQQSVLDRARARGGV